MSVWTGNATIVQNSPLAGDASNAFPCETLSESRSRAEVGQTPWSFEASPHLSLVKSLEDDGKILTKT